MKKAKKGGARGAGGDELSPLGRKMVAGADAFLASMAKGEAVEKRFTVRTVDVGPGPRDLKPDDVKAVRGHFRASQAVFADFLGVSVATLQSWEQGARPVPGIASRYLDDLLAFPQLWERRTRKVAAE